MLTTESCKALDAKYVVTKFCWLTSAPLAIASHVGDPDGLRRQRREADGDSYELATAFSGRAVELKDSRFHLVVRSVGLVGFFGGVAICASVFAFVDLFFGSAPQ